jgi:DNA-binding SARP family transcriptional activator
LVKVVRMGVLLVPGFAAGDLPSVADESRAAALERPLERALEFVVGKTPGDTDVATGRADNRDRRGGRARAAAGLEIALLGELEVRRDGAALALPASKKSRALLGYLCATGRPALRERLCTLLWDGPDDPRAALRWSLTKLRPLLDDARAQRLRADREHVGFEAGDATVDLHEVRSALGPRPAEAPLEVLRAAAARFRGNFLEGLELPGCHLFHAWWVGEREELHRLHLGVRTALIERLRDDPAEALRHARALLSLDPLAESSHVTVVRLLAEMGRAREALEQYERCRQILDAELGAKPSPELERLRMKLSGAPAPAPAAAAPVTASAVASPTLPLVGRIAERAALQTALDATAAGRGGELLLLAGDPGVGKTRLLEELRRLAGAGGAAVLAGRAFEAELVRPYGAWIEALRSAPRPMPAGVPLGELGALLPELGAAPAELDRTRLFEAVARTLRALAVPFLVVLFDDLQWFDEASAALLHFAVRGPGAERILFAASARGGELADNPAALRLLRGLEQERRVRRLPLADLDEAETAALVRAAAPYVDAHRVDAHRVYVESDGNPLFALEMARAIARDGSDRQDERVMGETLDDLIGERLGRLDERTRRLLPWAAALGRSFDPDVLARVSGMSGADVLEGLEDFERRGVLRGATGGGYDFAHDLVRRAAYRQMSDPRRRMVHLQIGRALQAVSDPEDALAGEVARHAGLGGDDELAAAACVRTAERCLRLFAHAEGAEVAARGFGHTLRLPAGSRLPLQISLLRLQVMNPLLRGRRAREIEAALTRATTEALAAGLNAEARTGLYMRSVIEFDEGNFAAAYRTTLQAARAVRAADPVTAAAQYGALAKCLVLIEKDLPQAAAMIDQARELAGPSGEDQMELVYAMGVLDHYRGETERAIASLERALVLTERRAIQWEVCDCHIRLGIIDLERGAYREVRARCETLIPLAARMGGDADGTGSESAVAAALDALARAGLGEATAGQALEAALAGLRTADAKGILAFALNLAAELDLAAGELARAAARAGQALAAAEAVGRTSQITLARAVLAQAAHAGGDDAAARAHLAPTAPLLAEPLGVSARSRRAAERARAALEAPASPTPQPRRARATA